MAQYFQGFALGPKSVKTQHIDIDNDLDFNSHKLINLGSPTNNTDGARKTDILNMEKWKVVYETTLSSNVSFIDITGLDINTDKEYHLTIITNETSDNFNHIKLYVNNDYNDNNYRNQGFYVVHTTITAFEELNPTILYIPSPCSAIAKIIIVKDPLNYIRYQTLANRENLYHFSHSTNYPTAVSNLTSLRISASATTIKTGTYILLTKPRG